MEIKNKDNAWLNDNDFFKLLEYIKFGAYQKIDEWFKKNKISKNQKLENYLVEKLVKEIRYFSPPISDMKYFDKKQHDMEKTEREITVLKNLTFKNQLKLLFLLDEINSNHFKVIKLTNKNKEILKSNKLQISFITTRIFWNENFTEIDKIQEILGFNIMEQQVNAVMFYSKQDGHVIDQFNGEYSYQVVYKTNLPISKPIFSPKCDIIFNYSEEKKKFLEERDIALPTIEEADALYHEIKKAFFNKENIDEYIDLIKKLDHSFKEYKAIKLNAYLENKLQIRNSTKRKIKI